MTPGGQHDGVGEAWVRGHHYVVVLAVLGDEVRIALGERGEAVNRGLVEIGLVIDVDSRVFQDMDCQLVGNRHGVHSPVGQRADVRAGRGRGR